LEQEVQEVELEEVQVQGVVLEVVLELVLELV
jgi:hypothetical protein